MITYFNTQFNSCIPGKSISAKNKKAFATADFRKPEKTLIHTPSTGAQNPEVGFGGYGIADYTIWVYAMKYEAGMKLWC